MRKQISIAFLLSGLMFGLVQPAHAGAQQGPRALVATHRAANAKLRKQEISASQQLGSSVQVGGLVHAGVGVGLFTGVQRRSQNGREHVSLIISPRAYRTKGAHVAAGIELDDRLQPKADAHFAPRHEVREVGGLGVGLGGFESNLRNGKTAGASALVAPVSLGFTASGKEHRMNFEIPLFSRRSSGIRSLDRSDAALDRAERMLDKGKEKAAMRALAKAERLSGRAAGQEYQRQHAPDSDVGYEH